MNTDQMTIEELRALKEQNYKNAEQDGTLLFLGNVARHLGEYQSCSYGPKYKWENDNIVIFVDDYGHFMTVSVDGEEVVSTHPCKRFIRGGGWFDEINAFRGEVEQAIKEKKEAWEQKQRQELLKMI